MSLNITNIYNPVNEYVKERLKDKYDKSFKRMEKYVHKCLTDTLEEMDLMDMLEGMNEDTRVVEFEVKVMPEVIVIQRFSEGVEG